MASFQSFVQNNPTPPPQPSWFQQHISNPISNAFQGAKNQISEGAQQIGSGQGNPIVQGTEGALKIGAGLVGMPLSLAAPVLNPTLGAATSGIANAVGNIPAVQKFAMSPTGQTTARVAGDVQNAGMVAGGILGTDAAAGKLGFNTGDLFTGHPIWKSPFTKPISPEGAVVPAQEQLNTAQQNYSQADIAANQATNTANATISGDVGKGGALGQEFGQGLKDIQKTNPTVRMPLPNEAVDMLKEIKSTKGYAIPKDLLDSIPDLKNLENGAELSLSPTDTGELLNQLNHASFQAKANGDMVVNQKYINLRNAIKSSADEAFGKLSTEKGIGYKDIYSNFEKGAQFRDKLDGIVNFNKNANVFDTVKQTDDLQKVLSTPGGEYQVNKYIEDYAKVRGEDKASVLEDLISKTKEVSKTHEILKLAETNMTEAVKLAEKGGFGKQFIAGLKNPQTLARYALRTAASIPVGIALLPYLRKLYQSLTQ